MTTGAHAVQRGVHPGHVARRRVGHQLDGAGQVGLDQFVAERLVVGAANDLGHAALRREGDLRGDVGVGGWHDLRASPR